MTLLDFEEPGQEFPYKRRGTCIYKGKPIGIVTYSYRTAGDRENHLKEESKCMEAFR